MSLKRTLNFSLPESKRGGRILLGDDISCCVVVLWPIMFQCFGTGYDLHSTVYIHIHIYIHT